MIIHIQFQHPFFLLYLFAIPLLILTHFILLERAKHKALRFANFEAIRKVTGEKPLTKNILLLVLRIIVLSSLVLAAAGPELWYKTRVIDKNIVFAIDASASMSTEDYYPSRLEVAKTVARRIINKMEGSPNIGVVSFSGVTFIDQTMTNSKKQTIGAIDSIEIIEAGGTDIPGAIITATNMMRGEEGKSIILFSDGSNTISYLLEDPVRRAIDYARNNNVVIYTIGIGSEGAPVGYLPEYYNIPSRFDEEVLRRISNETNGKYYRFGENMSIDKLVNDILEETKEGFLRIDLTHALLVLGLIGIFLEWGLINTRFRRIP